MPEITVWGDALVFYGFAISYLRRESKYKLIVIYIIACLMTLMRPYLLLFVFLPAFLMVYERNSKKKKCLMILINIGIIGCILAIYFFINKRLGAEYFTPLYKTEWLEKFAKEGFTTGLSNLIYTIRFTLLDLYYRMIYSIKYDYVDGAFFMMHIFIGVMFFIRIVIDVVKRILLSHKQLCSEEQAITKRLIIEIHFFMVVFAMFWAIVIMYKLTEGSKHLLTFISVGMILLIVIDRLEWLRTVFVAVVIVFFLWIKGNNPYNYSIFYGDKRLEERLDYWSVVFDGNMVIDETNAPNYENVIIWTFSDGEVTGEGMGEEYGIYPQYTDWQMLYKIPAGFGISCCEWQYVTENVEEIRSKYLAVIEGGIVDRIYGESDRWTEIGREGSLVVYERND